MTPEPLPSQDLLTFYPRRGRIVALAVGGATLLLFGIPVFFFGILFALPFLATPNMPPPPVVIAAPILTGTVLVLMAAWLILLAVRVRQMRVQIGFLSLDLRTSLYEWYLWNPWGVSRAQVSWDEVQGLRLWCIDNPLAEGSVQENYIIYTTRGIFVLSSIVWPDPDRIAVIIAERSKLRIARTLAELPPSVGETARPSSKEKVGLVLMRGFGWAFLGISPLVFLAAFLVLLGGQVGTAMLLGIGGLTMVTMGGALRRFRLE